MKLVINNTASLITLDDIYTNITYHNDSYVLANDESLVLNVNAILELFYVHRYDMMEMRKYLKLNVLPNWNTLLADEKLELEKLFIYPPGHTMVLSESEQLLYWKLLVDNEIISREERIRECKKLVSFYFDKTESYLIFLDTKELFRDYIDGETPNLLLWIMDMVEPLIGADYTTTGFGSKIYFSIDRRNMLLSILTK